MKFVPLKIQGAYSIELTTHPDHRGFFARTYDQALFKEQGLATHWVQESYSFSSRKGTLRGLHFQRPPHMETKLVRVVQGKIFMVMVDLRRGSPSLGSSMTSVLSQETPGLWYVPKGVALGMYTLTDNCALFYKMDTEYCASSQGAVRWDDGDLNVPWPLEGKPIFSDRDAQAMSFKDFLKAEGGFPLSNG